ncbi:dihydropyrimidinase [Rhodobacterales bacterium HTCC2654]|uniref:Dihydropyrimidinase n=1 Tax=Maritimibacter alkaliphilus HTCC2654 TaxID=314271 RepID=A3VH33_9RHOB|nr:dihydropyrimidinase [Rhodobacterales bacterium HTCC2654] [Maritimibacter alkaliphilus HTCC2654]
MPRTRRTVRRDRKLVVTRRHHRFLGHEGKDDGRPAGEKDVARIAPRDDVEPHDTGIEGFGLVEVVDINRGLEHAGGCCGARHPLHARRRDA